MKIVKTFGRYRHTAVVHDNWRGFAVTTAELVRALTIGSAQSARKSNGTQTEDELFETQSGGDPVDETEGDDRGSAIRRGSFSIFSKDFQNY